MTIKELRESKGLTQGKFAESIGIGRTAIVGYEKGKFKPKDEVITKIKEVYGVDVSDDAPANPSPADEKKPAKRTRKKKEEQSTPVKEKAPVGEYAKGEVTIGSAIKALRKGRGLSQKAFGESIGVKLPTVGAYEQGRIKPSDAVMAAIKKVYGEDALTTPVTKTVPVVEEQPAPKKSAKRDRKKKEAAAPAVEVEEKKPAKRGGRKKAAPVVNEQPVAVEAAPAVEEKKPTKRARKAAPVEAAPAEEKKPRGRKKVEAVEAEARKPAKGSRKKTEAAPKATVIIQSPLGGSITPEEILAKTGPVDAVYIRVDENKAYWVRGDETGAVDLW